MKKNKINICYLLFETIFIIVSFFLFYFIKKITFIAYIRQYYKLFAGFFFLWMITAFILEKFQIKKRISLSKIYLNILKTDFFNLAIISLSVYLFKIPYQSRIIVFGTTAIIIISELIYSTVYHFRHKNIIENDLLHLLDSFVEV